MVMDPPAGLVRTPFELKVKLVPTLVQAVWLPVAVELLGAGESVANVATALGYESVSAFIAMFKRLHGSSPARFMAALA